MADERKRELRNARERERILQGLFRAQQNAEQVLRIIAGAENDTEALTSIMAELDLDGAQGTAIMDMQFRRISRTERLRTREELAQTRLGIERLERGESYN